MDIRRSLIRLVTASPDSFAGTTLPVREILKALIIMAVPASAACLPPSACDHTRVPICDSTEDKFAPTGVGYKPREGLTAGPGTLLAVAMDHRLITAIRMASIELRAPGAIRVSLGGLSLGRLARPKIDGPR